MKIRWRNINFPLEIEESGKKCWSAPQKEKNLPEVRHDGTKWILDGSPIECGSCLSEDYKHLPGHRGKMNFDGHLEEMVAKCKDHQPHEN